MENYIMNTYGRFNVTFEKGQGSKLYDINGDEYLDFVSGVAVNALGHSHPSIVKAIEEQSKKLIHISNFYYNTSHTILAKKLIESSDHESVFFCNSGAEAIEGALKIARKHGKSNGDKSTIIYMDNSFHGRTLGSLSVTGQKKYQKDFMPLIGGVKNIPFNDLDALKANFTKDVCAIIVEPIQGEGGIINIDKDFLICARELCNKNNALLIFDEVQCGIGRLGTLFAYKKFDVIPDVICLAKGLGGGFPIGAIIANKEANVLVPGDHGSTFGGNPLACSVANAVLDELINGKIIQDIDSKSKYIFEKLEVLKSKYKVIKELRGMGLLIGIEVDMEAKQIINKCFEKKLLLISAGPNVIRLLPPLNVTFNDIDSCIDILSQSLDEICN